MFKHTTTPNAEKLHELLLDAGIQPQRFKTHEGRVCIAVICVEPTDLISYLVKLLLTRWQPGVSFPEVIDVVRPAETIARGDGRFIVYWRNHPYPVK